MDLLYVGLTHKNTPFSLLEKAHFSDEAILVALEALNHEKSILETVIVSTCNRTELYLVVDQLHTGKYYAKHFLADWFNIDSDLLEQYLHFKDSEAVLEHLLRVSIGLESKILGETQILGQLKRAFLLAQENGTTGVILNEVFRQVVTFAKQMHDHYRINARPLSIGLTAVQTLDKMTYEFQGKTALIVGLGEIGQLLTKYVLQKPFQNVHLVNRTLQKGEKFLKDDRVSLHAWEDLSTSIKEADVVFSAVKTGEYIIFPHMLKPSAICFDLCLPRTIHPGQGIQLFTIENLTNQLEIHQEERREIADKIVDEIQDELLKFKEWQKHLGIFPLIRDLREKALSLHESALISINRKIPDLTEREQRQISKHMKGIINQLIRDPILQLKEMSIGENAHYDIELFAKIFGLENEETK